MRSGRLDRKIEFPHPTEDARAKILQIHSRKMNVAPDVNFEELARSTDDFNAAQLKAVSFRSPSKLNNRISQRKGGLIEDPIVFSVVQSNPSAFSWLMSGDSKIFYALPALRTSHCITTLGLVDTNGSVS